MTHRVNLISDLTRALLVGVLSAVIFLAALMVMTKPRETEIANAPSITPYPRALTENRNGSVTYDVIYDENATGVPILCHHYIRPRTTPFGFVKILGALFLNLPLLGDMDVWTQTTSSFERQMAYLRDNGYESVDLADVVAWQRRLKELPPKPVVITFDDGDRSVLEFAFPILKRYGFKATLFIVTSQVGKKWDRVDCLDWDELKRLEETGMFSIQSHSHDLHRKVKTSEGDLPIPIAASERLYLPPEGESWTKMVCEDLERSRNLIREHVGTDARFLAWPYGFGNARLDSVAVSAGFHAMCNLEYGMNRPFRTLALTGAPIGAQSVETANMPYPGPVYYAASFTVLNPPLVHRRAGGSIVWEQFELGRYTITARTTLRGLETMLGQRRGHTVESIRYVRRSD